MAKFTEKSSSGQSKLDFNETQFANGTHLNLLSHNTTDSEELEVTDMTTIIILIGFIGVVAISFCCCLLAMYVLSVRTFRKGDRKDCESGSRDHYEFYEPANSFSDHSSSLNNLNQSPVLVYCAPSLPNRIIPLTYTSTIDNSIKHVSDLMTPPSIKDQLSFPISTNTSLNKLELYLNFLLLEIGKIETSINEREKSLRSNATENNEGLEIILASSTSYEEMHSRLIDFRMCLALINAKLETIENTIYKSAQYEIYSEYSITEV